MLTRLGVRRSELRDALLSLLFALIALLLAPDVHIGPYGALHPPSIARLIVLLMAISAAGSLAQRWFGPRYGLVLAGFVGGFISSSATIAALSLQAKEQRETWRSAVSGALASNVATIAQYALVVGTVDPELARRFAPSLLLGLASAVVLTWLAARGAAPSVAPALQPGRAFRLGAVLAVTALVCAVSIAAAALNDYAGSFGTIVVSAVAGFVDAHSTAGSVAALHESGKIDTTSALLAVLASLSANSVTKILLAFSGRQREFALRVTGAVLLIALAAWLGLIFEL